MSIGGNGIQVVDEGAPSGATFGSATSKPISFYGVTPITQPATISLVATTAPTTSQYGFSQAQASSLITAVNSLITALSATQGGNGLIA